MKNNIIIRKSGGFYYVLDEDAYIINYLFKYKIINDRCGFPINSLNKVTNVLEDNSINYIVKEKDNNITKNYNNNNKYSYILEKARKNYDINYRIEVITNKISKLSYDKLSNLLDLIEDNIDE